jgi:hypothetical protein
MQDQIETFGMMLIKGILAPAFAVFVTWAAAHLGAWIRSKVRNETTAGVLDRLAQLAFNVVQEVEQTIVSSLPDKADKAALLAARDQAIATLKSHLGEKGLRELMTVLGLKDENAVARILTSYIESSVLQLKTSTPTEFTTSVLQPDPPTTASTTTVEHTDALTGNTTKTVTVVQPGIPSATETTVNLQGTVP